MKKILIALFLSIAAALPAMDYSMIPDKIVMDQHWFSKTNCFSVYVDDVPVGQVYRKFFSLLPQYIFYDENEEESARAHMTFVSFAPSFYLLDNSGKSLGRVDEYFFAWFPTFDILNGQNEPFVKARMNFWGTKYTFTNLETQEIVGEMTRPFFSLKTTWTITIFDKELFTRNNLDMRSLFLIGAFQSDREIWQHHNQQQAKAPALPKKLTKLIEKYLVDSDQECPEFDPPEIRPETMEEDLAALFEGNEYTPAEKAKMAHYLIKP